MSDDQQDKSKSDLMKALDDVQSLLGDNAENASTKLSDEAIRKLATERSNPFLSGAPSPQPQPPQSSTATQAAPKQPTPAAPQTTPQAEPAKLQEQEITRIIDALVTETLPKLETLLRQRLRDALNKAR